MNNGFWFFSMRTLGTVLFLIVVFYISPYVYYWVRGAHLTYLGDKLDKAYVVGNPNNPKLIYIAMGDSTSLGTGVQAKEQTYVYMIAKSLADQGNYVEVKNISRNGAGVTAVLDYQVPQLKDLQPDVITLTAAANDVTHFTSTEEFKESFEAILKKLNEFPSAKIIIANTPNMGNIPAIPPFLKTRARDRAVKQNHIIDASIKAYPYKTADLFTKGSLLERTLYAADNFHPNEAGYSLWARVFIEEIE